MKTPNVLPLSSQDMEAQVVLQSNPKQMSGDGTDMVVGMIVVYLSFLAIFMVPLALKKGLGLAVATKAMESVWFQIFVAMDLMSILMSYGVVLIQAMGMNNITEGQRKRVGRMCSILGYIGMGTAAVAFVAAAIAFTTHL